MKSSLRFGLKASVVGVMFLTGPAYAADLPTGGQIVAGSGQLNQAGSTMTVTQDTANMAANWDSFSIGQGNIVNFVQPSSDAVALNRVLGSDVSVIQGGLNANGHVFLINPNGVTFTPDAQVNVGGLVASTQNIKTEDFLAGRYRFEGTSSNAIVNQGSIKAADGGSVALIAATIINEGIIEAPRGQILMGAGHKVTLDFGGPVKLEVEEGALDTLIEQGGALRANGGQIYLTAKAASDLSTSVINHTGVTEAQTRATGEAGEIILLADMGVGTTNVAGVLDASAPIAGDGGFIETSAAHVKVDDSARVTTIAADGDAGLWLIDPNDYTVAASGGDITGATLAVNLASGNVNITTTGAGGNLYVNDAVSWSANKLTLAVNNDILVNQNLEATGTGSLAFQYGQDSADGAGSSYTVADGVKVLIPAAANFTWQKGTGGAVNNLWFGNDTLKVSPNNAAALNGNGALLQPFYYDDGTQDRTIGWYKLTYSSYPLDFAIGTGGVGTNSWNANGQIISTDPGDVSTPISGLINSLAIDIGKYKEGVGTLTSTLNVFTAENSGTTDIINSYLLEADQSYIKTNTTVVNKSASEGLSNVRLWVGTRDDYVATSDNNYKTKGNLGDGFEQLETQNEQSKAIKVTEKTDGTGAAILFYSTSDGADTVTDSCCDFDNVIAKDPRTSDILTPREDGSYGLFLRMSDLAAGQSESLIWYYAASQANKINEVVGQVAQSAGVSTTTTTSTNTTEPQNNAIATAQSTASASATTSTAAPTQNTGGVSVFTGGNSPSGGAGGSLSVGSMDIVEVDSATFDSGFGGSGAGFGSGSSSRSGTASSTSSGSSSGSGASSNSGSGSGSGSGSSSGTGSNSSSSSSSSSGDGADSQSDDGGQEDGGSNVFGSQGSNLGPTRVFVVDGGVRLPVSVSNDDDNQEEE